MLPSACGLGQHFQVQGHSFSLYGPTLTRQLIIIIFFSCDKLGLRNFVTELVYVPSTNHRKESNERTSE